MTVMKCGLAISHGWPCPYEAEFAALDAVADAAQAMREAVGGNDSADELCVLYTALAVLRESREHDRALR